MLRVITVTNVLSTALKIVKHVDTQTAFALVRMDGWESTVPQVKTDVIRMCMAYIKIITFHLRYIKCIN